MMKAIKYFLCMIIAAPIISCSSHTTPAVTLEKKDIRGDNDKNGFELVREGGGKNSVIQGITVDENKIYTITTVGKPANSTINKFSFSAAKTLFANQSTLPSDSLGHQGLAVVPGTDYLITSAGNEYPKSGQFIVRFRFTNNTLPSNVEPIRVFDESFSTKTVSTPAISSDGKFLIVYGKKDGRDTIRTIDLRNTDISSSDDITTSLNNEWVLKKDFINKENPIQAIASDGEFVYILAGGPNEFSKRIIIYSMKGKFVNIYLNINTGRVDAQNIGQEHRWEPEGLAIDANKRRLLIMFAMGDQGKRVIKVYPIRLDYNY